MQQSIQRGGPGAARRVRRAGQEGRTAHGGGGGGQCIHVSLTRPMPPALPPMYLCMTEDADVIAWVACGPVQWLPA